MKKSTFFAIVFGAQLGNGLQQYLSASSPLFWVLAILLCIIFNILYNTCKDDN